MYLTEFVQKKWQVSFGHPFEVFFVILPSKKQKTFAEPKN